MLKNIFRRNFCIKLKDFAEFSSKNKTFKLSNYINGEWKSTAKYEEFPDPLKGGKMLEVPLTEKNEFPEIVKAMKECPKHGLHNPLKNVERYLLYGQVCRKVAQALHDEEIFDHFIKLIQRCFPKSTGQAYGEMKVTRAFFENFSGDNVRFLARGVSSPGDHDGQQTHSYRWPYGPVSIVAPFNFPIVFNLVTLRKFQYCN
jgi:1-pyrroline-5-carboxylate dehydrogenase